MPEIIAWGGKTQEEALAEWEEIQKAHSMLIKSILFELRIEDENA